MKKSKKLQAKIKERIKYAIGVIALLILCTITAIYGGSITTNRIEQGSKSIAQKLENTETEKYLYDARDIEIFRDSVNSGNDYAGQTIYLMQDIDLSEICSAEVGTWEPIGTDETCFAGTFDGKYHKISNLYINTNEYQTLGFFKETAETTIIKNVILENIDITSSYEIPANNTYVGGLVGWNSVGSQIINCGIKSGKIEDKIVAQNANNAWYGPVIGGIAGRSNGIIDGCYNKAEIIGTAQTNANYTETMSGGLVGALRGELTNSYNTGKVTGTSYISYVGGATGNADNTYSGKIENVYNKGDINLVGASPTIGGLIGRNGWSTDYNAINTENSYAINQAQYTSYGFNGTTVVADTEGKITRDELKTYAITLGEKFAYDLNNINDKDPILYWEAEYPVKAKLNINQTYINVGEKLQLNVEAGNIEDTTNNASSIIDIMGNNYTSNDFEWVSTNEDIAKVNGSGQVTGLKDGYTCVYATHKYTDENGNEKAILAECIINVSNNIAVPQTETGNGFTAILKADGTVWKVGNNTNNIDGQQEGVPTQIKISETENLTNIVKISAGTNEILALTKFGQIYTYNINDTYATVGAGPVSAQEESKNSDNIKTTILNNIVDISAGNNKFIALDKDGNVYTWTGETEPTKQNVENIIRVSSGNGNIGALESNGVLWTWGENGKGQLGLNSKTNLEYPLAVTTDVTEISSGGVHTVIQKTDKKLYATGDMYQTATFEEIALPENVTETNPVKYFKTGYNTTGIMLKDGTIYGEGGNLKGELGIGTNENASKFTKGLTSESSPLNSALMIGSGIGNGETSSLNTTVILENGDVYVTGDNTNGQIGDGTTEDKTYYTKLGYAKLDYEDKEIILDETGYQIDLNKLKYIETALNVYDNYTPLTVGKIEYTSGDTSLATVDKNGFITAKKMSGTTEITIKDVDNGYETKITVLVNRLLVDTDTVLYIYNIDDLVKFRDSVNAGNDYAGKTVYVMADIDMSPACSETVGSWTPIGVTGTVFAGTFDGNYHILSNLYFNSDNFNENVGLFAQNNGTIQNLVLDNVNIYAYKTGVNDNIYAGGIAGYNAESIINCGINSGNITGYNMSSIPQSLRIVAIGGISGWSIGAENHNAKVISCYNKANIIAQDIKDYSEIVDNTAGYAGGIVGAIYNTQIENCYNTGATNANGSRAHSGGIVGNSSRRRNYKKFIYYRLCYRRC